MVGPLAAACERLSASLARFERLAPAASERSLLLLYAAFTACLALASLAFHRGLELARAAFASFTFRPGFKAARPVLPVLFVWPGFAETRP